MATQRQTLERLKQLQNKSIKTESMTEEEKIIADRNRSEWVTIFRKNISLFISSVLGINTFPFQHMLYHEVNLSSKAMVLATRGTGKIIIKY